MRSCWAVPPGHRLDVTQPTGSLSSHTRRWLLGAVPVLAAAVAGCTSLTGQPTQSAADAATRDRARQTELDLGAAYDAALGMVNQLGLGPAQQNQVSGILAVIRDHHHEHARALAEIGPSPLQVSAPATFSAPATVSPPATGFAAPAAVLGDLARRESVAATGHRDGCLAADGDLAALMASLHAAETCHVDLLVGIGAPVPPQGNR